MLLRSLNIVQCFIAQISINFSYFNLWDLQIWNWSLHVKNSLENKKYRIGYCSTDVQFLNKERKYFFTDLNTEKLYKQWKITETNIQRVQSNAITKMYKKTFFVLYFIWIFWVCITKFHLILSGSNKFGSAKINFTKIISTNGVWNYAYLTRAANTCIIFGYFRLNYLDSDELV